MMKNLLTLVFITIAFIANAQCPNAVLVQNFDNNSAATPPAGWIVKNVDFTGTLNFPAYSGINRIGMNDTITDSVITKPIYCPGTLNFYWRASGGSSNYKVRIEYSQNGTTWFPVDSISTTGSGSPLTYQFKSVVLPTASFAAPFNTRLRWNMTRRLSGTFYIDSVCVSAGACSVIPTQLRFENPPSNCIPSGSPFGFKVCATDANGFVDSSFALPITVSLQSGSGTLSGITAAIPTYGCAKFNSVQFAGSAPLSIKANAGGLTTPVFLSSLNIQPTCPAVDTFKIVTYNVLNFPLGGQYALGGVCTPDQVDTSRADTLRNIMNYIKPDIMIVQELQTEQGADDILNRALNAGGVSIYARAPYIENRSTANKKYNNECFYNTNKLGLIAANTLGTSIRDCGQYIFYCKDPLLNVHNDTTFIDLYSIHTKAKGLGVAQAALDSIQRGADCLKVMDSIRYRQSSERNAIIGGDMNLYTSTEVAYQNFTTGLYKFNDPVNQPGAWESNIAFAPLHSQAVRATTDLSLECGARGGLDSRLDFLLATDPIMNNGMRMEYVQGSYKITGNSGNLFNKAINHPTNTSGVPVSVLNSLFNMSDHLPVEMKVAVSYPTLAPLGLSNIIFTGKLNKDVAQLNWNLQDYTTIKKVELIKAIAPDFSTFKTLFKDAPTQNEYTQNDAQLIPGSNLYKLKIVDKNDRISFSNVVNIVLNGVSINSVSPNPFSNTLTINAFHNSVNEITFCKLYDLMGKEVLQANISGLANCSTTLNTENLQAGIYVLSMQNGQVHTSVKVIKK
jgi:Secretion system C-terminal sorting domain